MRLFLPLKGNKQETTLCAIVASQYRGGARDMSRVVDVVSRIRTALAFDANRLQEIADEMERLAEAYHRYQALSEEADKREKSLHGLKALLGHELYYKVMLQDQTAAIGENAETLPTAAQLRESTPLWMHLANYLRFVPEARLGEIVDFLNGVGLEATRQAVESAIQAHRKLFVTKKRGREKFIALKK
jgi:hypothetical protein